MWVRAGLDPALPAISATCANSASSSLFPNTCTSDIPSIISSGANGRLGFASPLLLLPTCSGASTC